MILNDDDGDDNDGGDGYDCKKQIFTFLFFTKY